MNLSRPSRTPNSILCIIYILMYTVNPLETYHVLFLLYLFLFGRLLHREALVNPVLNRRLAHQADWLLVVLAKDLQPLVVQTTDFLVFVALLLLILIRRYL